MSQVSYRPHAPAVHPNSECHILLPAYIPPLYFRMMFEAFGFSKDLLALQKPISATFGRSALAG